MDIVKGIVTAAAVTVFMLAALDVIDLHFCGGRLCIAPAGECHVCDAATVRCAR